MVLVGEGLGRGPRHSQGRGAARSPKPSPGCPQPLSLALLENPRSQETARLVHPEQQVPPDELPPCPHTSTTLSTLSRLPVSDSSMPEAARRGGLSGEDPGEAAVPGPLLVLASPLQGPQAGSPAPGPHRFGPDPSAEPFPAASICGGGGRSLEAAHPREGAWEPPQLPLGTAWGLLGQEWAEGA